MFIINGELTATLPVQDRGLHYGDGLFETLAIHDQQPLCWDSHYRRLITGCRRLGLPCPPQDQLLSEAKQLCVHPGKAVLKIIITRGSGGRGYQPPAQPPVRILGLYPWPDYPSGNYDQGIKTRMCETRLGHNPQLAGIKHLNRLEQVLARSEWNDPEIAEGIMRDIRNNIIEGTASNLFLISGENLITPDLSACGIAGIIREKISELAAHIGLRLQITTVSEPQLLNADEIFLCNSIMGVWPVRQIDAQVMPVGPWAGKIRSALLEQALINE